MKKKQKYLIALLVLLAMAVEVKAGTIWVAEATWYFNVLNSTKSYKGYGSSQGAAFNQAKRNCIDAQQINSWKGYCQSTPTNVSYKEQNDCGSHWSVWTEIGKSPGNPCPHGCERSEYPIGKDLRSVGLLPPRPQYKDKFLCFGTPIPLPPPAIGFILHTGTALHETGGEFEFDVLPNGDIVAIKKSGTGTGSTEVHILSAGSGYKSFSLQTGTALHETDEAFSFAVMPNKDLVAIMRSGTGSKTTEIYILNGADNYRSFKLQTGTALHEVGDNFSFDVLPNGDVVAIKKFATGSRTTEIHILDASKGYKEFRVQTGTALHETGDSFDFTAMPNGDVVAIKKSGTGTKSTEVHILDASRGYQAFRLQMGSKLHETDNSFAFAALGDRIFAIKKRNTGTKTTEIHVLKP